MDIIPKGARAPIIHHYEGDFTGNFLAIRAAFLYQLSCGSTHITSVDPSSKLVINVRYLEHQLNLEVPARFLIMLKRQRALGLSASTWSPTVDAAMEHRTT
ncbi:hypothetical protein BKA67DRAFT_539148 [Truncatella angustata]|uniref:Uncharacterized protein n=1 Tax=Truncatella angustata TaxID=152316 RepID=A0A9P8UFV8_9PEZI|nr:uncharacterized protein BKA67DRAFT_539148 [Truncatella angustata]KAH6649154.1 hypothetical protein BKA67DRAFT_539148 [Truncatella angustata]